MVKKSLRFGRLGFFVTIAILTIVAMVAEPVRNPQDNATLAWNCGAYVFGVSDIGHVTLDTGSTGWNEPAQKADVMVNGTKVATLDVPATTANKHYDLGDVSVPATGGFDWEVKGVDDCGNKGHANGQQEQKNSAWPQTSYSCETKSYEVTIIVTSGQKDHTESEKPLKGQLTSEAFDMDVKVVFKSGEPVTLSVHIPSLLEAGCGEQGENFANPLVKYNCTTNVASIDIEASEGATVEPADHVELALTGEPQTAKFTVTFPDGEKKDLEVKVLEIKKACATKVNYVPPVAGGMICVFQWHNIPANTELWANWTTGPNGSEGKRFNGWVMTDEKAHLLITTNKGENNKGWLIVTEGTTKWYVYVENNDVYNINKDNHGCYVYSDDATTFDEGVAGSSMVVAGKGSFEIPAWHFSAVLKEATANGGIFNQTGGIVMVNKHIIVAHESQFPSVKVLKSGMTVRINGVQYVVESVHELDKTLAGIYAANISEMIVITCNKDWSANMVFTLKKVQSDLIKYII